MKLPFKVQLLCNWASVHLWSSWKEFWKRLSIRTSWATWDLVLGCIKVSQNLDVVILVILQLHVKIAHWRKECLLDDSLRTRQSLLKSCHKHHHPVWLSWPQTSSGRMSRMPVTLVHANILSLLLLAVSWQPSLKSFYFQFIIYLKYDFVNFIFVLLTHLLLYFWVLYDCTCD